MKDSYYKSAEQEKRLAHVLVLEATGESCLFKGKKKEKTEMSNYEKNL